jgi:hypothetical protein
VKRFELVIFETVKYYLEKLDTKGQITKCGNNTPACEKQECYFNKVVWPAIMNQCENLTDR